MQTFEIKQADILLVRGNDGLSHEIEAITKSIYSHAALVVKPTELVESQAFRRTGYQAIDTYKGCSDIFTCDALSDDQRKRIVAFVLTRIGNKYDYLLLPWEAEHYLLHIDLPYKEGSRSDCSSLCQLSYESEGLKPAPAGVKFMVPGDWGISPIMRKSGSY